MHLATARDRHWARARCSAGSTHLGDELGTNQAEPTAAGKRQGAHQGCTRAPRWSGNRPPPGPSTGSYWDLHQGSAFGSALEKHWAHHRRRTRDNTMHPVLH
jgi:hypothetical protein